MSVGLTARFFVDTVSGMGKGRPKKPEGEARAGFLRIRVTAEERRALDDAAKSKSLETSTWARSELLTLAKKMASKK